jgi:hypothetical protein
MVPELGGRGDGAMFVGNAGMAQNGEEIGYGVDGWVDDLSIISRVV